MATGGNGGGGNHPRWWPNYEAILTKIYWYIVNTYINTVDDVRIHDMSKKSSPVRDGIK